MAETQQSIMDPKQVVILGIFFLGLNLVVRIIRRRSRSPRLSIDPSLAPLQDKAPLRAQQSGALYKYGRYKTPILDPNVTSEWFLGKLLLPRFRLKEWHFISIATNDALFALAIANVGYVANAWCFVLDARPGKRSQIEYRALTPLAAGITSFARGSTNGTTAWRQGRNTMTIEYDPTMHAYKVDVSVVMETVDDERKPKEKHPPKQCRCNAVISARFDSPASSDSIESLALLYPLDMQVKRAAYTHKGTGLRVVSGHLEISELDSAKPATSKATSSDLLDVDLTDSLSSFDWTRSFASRRTTWKWANFSAKCRKTGRTVGLNLSAEVYKSRENHVLVGSTVYLAGPAQFSFESASESGGVSTMSAQTNGAALGDTTARVSLEFEPLGARKEHVNFLIIKDDFAQYSGRWKGSVELINSKKEVVDKLEIEGALGVAETHVALW